MLPKKFANKLLAVATAAKEKVKADKEAAAAAAAAAGLATSDTATSGGGFLSSLTAVGRKPSQFTTESSELSKDEAISSLKEENNTGIPTTGTTPAPTPTTTTTAAAAAALPDTSGDGAEPDSAAIAAAAAAAHRNPTMAPARSVATAAVMDNLRKESKFDKAVSLITRRLVGEKGH